MLSDEQTVVAGVLLDSRYLADAMRVVQPSDFADQRLARILAEAVAMAGRGEPVDVVTIGARLHEWGIEGITAVDLHRWVGEVPTAANVGYYAELVVRSGLQRALVRVSTRLRDDAEGDPAGAARDAMRELEALQRRAVGDEVVIRSFGDIIDLDGSHDWLVPGLLERRDRLMLTGPEGFGKSLLLQQFVIAAALGVDPFRAWKSVEPRRCLVIDAENTERQWKRRGDMFLRALDDEQALPALRRQLHVVNSRRLDVTRPRDLAFLHEACDRVQPDVVMIGPLYRLTSQAIQTDDEAAPVLAALDTLRDRGVALLIEAHAGKSVSGSGERNLAPRGSSALLGWPEFGLGLRPVRGSRTEAELVRWRGDREERRWPRTLTKSATGMPWQDAGTGQAA